jgi:hypothetical protein
VGWNFSKWRGLLSRNRENNHGTKIFEESIGQGRARDEEAQGWNVEERPLGAEGQEPQAGNCHRSFRGEGGRKQGSEEGLEEEEDGQKAQIEKVVHSNPLVISSWPGLTRPSKSFFLLRRQDVDARDI